MTRLLTITDANGHTEIEKVEVGHGGHGGGHGGGRGGRGRGRGGGFFFGPSYYADDLDAPWRRPRFVYLDELPPGVQVVP